MKQKTFEVKVEGGDSWEFNINDYPENFDEAIEKFGPKGAFDIFTSALDVRYQNAGREKFRKGKTREEVEQEVNAYQPGGGRSSKKAMAHDLLMDNASKVASDPSLKDDVKKAFSEGDWDTVINLLSD